MEIKFFYFDENGNLKRALNDVNALYLAGQGVKMFATEAEAKKGVSAKVEPPKAEPVKVEPVKAEAPKVEVKVAPKVAIKVAPKVAVKKNQK